MTRRNCARHCAACQNFIGFSYGSMHHSCIHCCSPQTLELLERAIIDHPPVLIRDGGVIAPGYDPELDELRGLKENVD